MRSEGRHYLKEGKETMSTSFGLDAMSVVLDSDNAEALSAFYAKLLGWTRVPFQPGDEWIVVYDEKSSAFALVFQQVDDYRRPVWPWTPDRQQQMAHLDFYVEHPEAAVAHALACGAALSEIQLEEGWKVLLDPAGHPFCVIPKRTQ